MKALCNFEHSKKKFKTGQDVEGFNKEEIAILIAKKLVSAPIVSVKKAEPKKEIKKSKKENK